MRKFGVRFVYLSAVDMDPDWLNHPFEKPLDAALDLESSLHLFIVVQLYHCPTRRSPLASISQQPSVATWSLKAFYWHAPAFVLLVFTERMRDVSSLPLPLFLRRSRLLLKSSAIPCLTSCQSGQWQSLCLPPCDRLDTGLHPTSQYRTNSFAFNLLPGKSSWPHYDASRSKPFRFLSQ